MYHWDKVETDGKRSTLGQFYQLVTENAAVLDIGCACGDFGKTLHEQKHCTMTGVEYDSTQADIAMATGAYRQVIVFDLNQLREHQWPEFEHRFDYIVCADVLEHLLEPSATLNALKSYLKPDGKFLISLPNVAHASVKADLMNDLFNYTPHGFLDRTHLRFFTWKSIGSFLALAGVRIVGANATFIDIKGYSIPPPDYDSMSPHILYMIFRDLHSYICQYTMTAVPENKMTADELNQANIDQLNFNVSQFPPEIRQYATELLAACGYHKAPPDAAKQ